MRKNDAIQQIALALSYRNSSERSNLYASLYSLIAPILISFCCSFFRLIQKFSFLPSPLKAFEYCQLWMQEALVNDCQLFSSLPLMKEKGHLRDGLVA
mmetsp:Transcript_10023/g.14889  ORF Transcript_10023/g.14889 Transcript_10023/m.14889 type:complete len:98 (-) Transcript_10023:2135-2428(-)